MPSQSKPKQPKPAWALFGRYFDKLLKRKKLSDSEILRRLKAHSVQMDKANLSNYRTGKKAPPEWLVTGQREPNRGKVQSGIPWRTILKLDKAEWEEFQLRVWLANSPEGAAVFFEKLQRKVKRQGKKIQRLEEEVRVLRRRE